MTFALILTAFFLLMAGTYRQSGTLPGVVTTPGRRRFLLCLGYAMLVASLIPACWNIDWARRLVEWFGDLSAAALLAIGYGWQQHQGRSRS